MFGSGKVSDAKLSEIVEKNFDFTPAGMISYYNLKRPIYKATARFGHVGVDRPEVTWEKLEKVDALRRDGGVRPAESAPAAKVGKTETRKPAKARK